MSLAIAPSPSDRLWVRQFCVELMKRRNDITLGTAVQRAMQASAHAELMSAQSAARIDAAVRWSA